MIEGRLAFAFFCARIAHAIPVKGQCEQKWGWDRTYILKWTNYIQHWLFHNYNHLLEMHPESLTPQLPYMCTKVGEKMGFADPTQCGVFGMIDGVFMVECMPRVFQEAMYNTYYKGHGIKHQAIVYANGLIGDLFGGIPGRHHDTYLWDHSGCPRNMDDLPDRDDDRNRYHILGDPAYRAQRCNR